MVKDGRKEGGGNESHTHTHTHILSHTRDVFDSYAIHAILLYESLIQTAGHKMAAVAVV